MYQSYDSSFQEYCSFCEQRLANGDSIYCSKDCQLKDLYVNTNTASRRASANFVQFGTYYDPLSSNSAIPSPSSSSSSSSTTSPLSSASYHDYSLSAINDANSPTSLRTANNTMSPLSFPSAALQYYNESTLKSSSKENKDHKKRHVTTKPNVGMNGESAAYWKSIQQSRNSFR
ncbi:hypothetical protein DASC09_053650 [Saccharomycopsis crataegensis]|uniref:Uncharacterized protein n=1 Tax=Saccharomycopsis crataegensis TaxID=43959 RepID=A0AAV5QTW1_9ASCO|nr:hypothetical protein DASC09_053650 [Saccharomycopsis crataegensis]